MVIIVIIIALYGLYLSLWPRYSNERDFIKGMLVPPSVTF